jgi:LPS export ABC transporter protein LptC
MNTNFIINTIGKTLAVAGVLLFSFACKNNIEEVQQYSETRDTAQIIQEHVEIIHTRFGKKEGMMKAPLLKQYAAEEETFVYEFPEGIEIEMYEKDGSISASIKADYSIYKENEGIWIGRYNVVAVNEEGKKLSTEYMVWDRNKKTISSDQFVTFESGSQTFYGDGFVSDEKMENIEMTKGSGHVFLDSDE